MKFSLSLLALLASLCAATAAFAAAEISVAEPTFNFGTIPQGKKVPHNFVFKNSGDAPLLIKDVSVSCGCTAAKPSATTVAPGKSAEIQVVFDSGNFFGKVQKTVTVVTNAGRVPSYTFAMEGTIVEVLQVNPRQLSLGPIKPGIPRQASVSVTNRDSVTVRLLSANATSTSLQIKPTIKKSELKPGETGSVELTITGNPDAKVMSGYLHIMTDSTHKKELTIPVYGSLGK